MKSLIFLILLNCFFVFSVYSTEEECIIEEPWINPFELQELSIDGDISHAVINFNVKLLYAGNVSFQLHSNDENIVFDRNKIYKCFLNENMTYQKTWNVSFKQDGYYLFEIFINFIPEDTNNTEIFADFNGFPLYVEVKNGNIVNYRYEPDIKNTVLLESNKGELEINSKKLNYSKENSYLILIKISGRLQYRFKHPETNSEIYKGVPNVMVYLDWDNDNDPTTGYTPYGGNTQHVNFDISDDNGYYYFDFIFASNNPANHHASKIRVYSMLVNSAAFHYIYGNGAYNTQYKNIDISSATTSVAATNANVTMIVSWEEP